MPLEGDRLTRFRSGDGRVLADVYRQHVAGVASFLRRGFSYGSRNRILRFRGYAQPFELDNALQETFARAFRPSARQAYDGLRPYRSYLLAIARNVVLDELRRGQPTTVDELDDCADVAASLSAEERLLRGELRRLWADFVERLDAHEAAYFLARFGEQRSRREAGLAGGLTPMQTRTLERKLRARFLEFLQAHGYLESYGGETAGGLLRAV